MRGRLVYICSHMDRRAHQPILIILIIIIPVLIIGGVFVYLNSRSSHSQIPIPANFLPSAMELMRIESMVPSSIRLRNRSDMPGDRNAAVQISISPGDEIDLAYIHTSFHPIQGGYIGVDFTRRRAIQMDEELKIVSALDRSQSIPNGIWQNIDEVRVDSSGLTYMLDRTKHLIQLLDADGNYVRRHMNLGTDLFGSPMTDERIEVDKFDRLWVYDPDRIYIFDRDGNLVRIFERRGAPYNRTNTPGMSIPSEHTPQGYTVLPSRGPVFGKDLDLREPVVLDVGSIDGVYPSTIDTNRFYVADYSSGEIIVYDWAGEEIGSIRPDANTAGKDYGFAVGSDGYCYLIDGEGGKVEVLGPSGERIQTIGIEGIPKGGYIQTELGASMNAQLVLPVGVWIDGEDRLVVLDLNDVSLTVWKLRE